MVVSSISWHRHRETERERESESKLIMAKCCSVDFIAGQAVI